MFTFKRVILLLTSASLRTSASCKMDLNSVPFYTTMTGADRCNVHDFLEGL